MLAKARAQAIAEGLKPSIYSHPLGYHGHAAGPAIGFWDNQNGDERGIVQGAPEHRLVDRALGLRRRARVGRPGGGQFRAEENAFFDGATVRFLDGRQTALTLIPSR